MVRAAKVIPLEGRMKSQKKRSIDLASQKWTPEKYRAFSEEIDAVQKEVVVKLGKEDLKYLDEVWKTSKNLGILGRLLIQFSFDPITWGAGALALGAHKLLNTSEIGHYALHGAWDRFPEAKKFHSKEYRWTFPVEEGSWRKEHNVAHHQFTNILGRDPDTHYHYLRISEKVPWSLRFLFQVPMVFMIAPWFSYAINPHATGLSDLLFLRGKEFAPVLPNRELKTIVDAAIQSGKKLVPYVLKEFVLWPLLAGPFFLKVLVGNILSEMARDIYLFASIFPGHLVEGLKIYNPGFKAHGRGEWYKAQVESTSNYEVGRLVGLLCGALERQIEHHLFPKLPPNRLREIAPKIKEICQRYGIKYTTDSWGGTFRKVMKNLWKMSSPPFLAQKK